MFYSIKNKPLEIKFPKCLIVEGDDEAHFLDYILKKILDINDVQIYNMQGQSSDLSEILASLYANDKDRLIEKIAVIIDAETEPAKLVFNRIFTAFADKEVNKLSKKEKIFLIKNHFDAAWIDLKNGLGAFICPNCNSEGMLEDLFLGSKELNVINDCIDSYLACVELKLNQPLKKRSKVRLHAFLALDSKNPGLRLTQACRDAKIFDVHADPVFIPIKEFLITMFKSTK